jgi:hypothetical protein
VSNVRCVSAEKQQAEKLLGVGFHVITVRLLRILQRSKRGWRSLR